MAERILFPQWRASTDPIKYPFSDRATLVNAAGRVIQEGTCLDGALYPIGGVAGLFLSQVTLTHDSATLWIGNTTNRLLASGTFALLDNNGIITFADAYGRPAGMLLSEPQRLAVFQSWGVGTHEFTREQTEFAATVHFPVPQIGVSAIQLETGEVLTGEVWLVGSDGVVFRADTAKIPSVLGELPVLDTVVRMDVVGDPLFRRRLCTSNELFQGVRPIKKVRIVGNNQTYECTPDELGNIEITVVGGTRATVLRVMNTPDGVRISAVGQTPVK